MVICVLSGSKMPLSLVCLLSARLHSASVCALFVIVSSYSFRLMRFVLFGIRYCQETIHDTLNN